MWLAERGGRVAPGGFVEAGMPSGNGRGADHSLLLLGRGMLDLQAGRLVEAARGFAELIEASPEDPTGYRYLAVALRKMGREKRR